MAITALAAGLPLLFYAAFPLKSSFESLETLQIGLLKTKMNAAESMVKQRRTMLEDTASLLAASTDLRQQIKGYLRAVREEKGGSTSIRISRGHFQDIDLAYTYSMDGSIETLTDMPKDVSMESLSSPVLSWVNSRTRISPSTSGFGKVDGRKFLLAMAKVSAIPNADGDPEKFVVVGIDLEDSDRLTDLTGFSPGDVTLMVADPATARQLGSDATPFEANELNVGIKRIQKSFDTENPFLLTLFHPRGEYDQIESNQIWFFVAFLLGAYLAAVIGTAGSAAVVLRPLGRLIETMRSVSGPSTYNHRAPEDRKDEIGQLAINFNRLMRRLQVAQRELQIAQKHALEAEKLETVHAMVITLAHEINNPLTALLGEAEMLLMDGRLVPADRSSVEVIRNMSMRIQRVIIKLQDVQAVEMTAYTDWQQMIKVDLEDTHPVNPVGAP